MGEAYDLPTFGWTVKEQYELIQNIATKYSFSLVVNQKIPLKKFALHRKTTRPKRNRFAGLELCNVGSCPTRYYLNCSKNLTSLSNIKRMSSSEYINAHMRSSPNPKAKPE